MSFIFHNRLFTFRLCLFCSVFSLTPCCSPPLMPLWSTDAEDRFSLPPCVFRSVSTTTPNRSALFSRWRGSRQGIFLCSSCIYCNTFTAFISLALLSCVCYHFPPMFLQGCMWRNVFPLVEVHISSSIGQFSARATPQFTPFPHEFPKRLPILGQ